MEINGVSLPAAMQHLRASPEGRCGWRPLLGALSPRGQLREVGGRELRQALRPPSSIPDLAALGGPRHPANLPRQIPLTSPPLFGHPGPVPMRRRGQMADAPFGGAVGASGELGENGCGGRPIKLPPQPPFLS